MNWQPESADLLLCFIPAQRYADGTLSADSAGKSSSGLPIGLAAEHWASDRDPAGFP